MKVCRFASTAQRLHAPKHGSTCTNMVSQRPPPVNFYRAVTRHIWKPSLITPVCLTAPSARLSHPVILFCVMSAHLTGTTSYMYVTCPPHRENDKTIFIFVASRTATCLSQLHISWWSTRNPQGTKAKGGDQQNHAVIELDTHVHKHLCTHVKVHVQVYASTCTMQITCSLIFNAA